MPTPETTISLHNSCRAVWVCERCGNCARHCKHDDPANFHEDLHLPCSGPCQCIDCVPADEPLNVEPFRIKPLEWEWFDDTLDGVLKARGFKARFGTCFVGLVFQEERPNPEKWSTWHWMPKEGGTHVCASPEEGKQLAEQHWQEYIKQALVPVETEL